MHALSRYDQSFEQFWAKVQELEICFASNKLYDLFNFSDENHLLSRTSYWPVLEKTLYYVNSDCLVLFYKVFHAGLQLSVEVLHASHLV